MNREGKLETEVAALKRENARLNTLLDAFKEPGLEPPKFIEPAPTPEPPPAEPDTLDYEDTL